MLTVGICTDDTNIYINHDEPGNFHRLATLTVHDAENIAQKLLGCVVEVRSRAHREQLLKDLHAVFDNYEPRSFRCEDLTIIACAVSNRLRALDADPNAEE